MSYDLNDAQPQMAPIGELIPDGTFAKVRLTIRPGGVNGATPADAGLLKASQSSDARMLDCEFTVVNGPHARRKFWQSFTVAGGKLDEKGQSIGWKISKSTFRAIVDSALGLDPRDESPAAKAKRVLPGLRHLDGIVFAARIMVEPASNPQYRDQNRIANVVLPDELHHAAIMRGETVPPDPVNAPPRKAASVAAPGMAGVPGAAKTAVGWVGAIHHRRARRGWAGRPAHDARRMAGACDARRRAGDRNMARGPRKTAPPHRKPHPRRPRGHGQQRDLALDRDADREAPAGGMATRRPDRELLARVALCAVCAREAHGFGYCHGLQHDRYPYHRFCSLRCQDVGSAIAQRMNGMIDKTAREAQAIRDARQLFAEALTDLGLMEPFFHRTAADIDRLIEAAVTGYVDSMLAQGARKERTGTTHDDPIPF